VKFDAFVIIEILVAIVSSGEDDNLAPQINKARVQVLAMGFHATLNIGKSSCTEDSYPHKYILI